MGTNSTTPHPYLSTGHWIIDGTGWSFSAIVYDTTNIDHKNIVLDPANIKLFEYTNQWNALVLTGQLVYKDSERNLGKLFRIPHLLVRVEWAENRAKKKNRPATHGDGGGDYWVEKPIKKEDYFSHVFLVNKMEIIEHDTKIDVTTYRLELVSAAWYKLSQVCQYSNYNLKKPQPITEIICQLLVDAVGLENVGTKTFLEAPCKTDICIYYTTTQKDNYFTAINYLLNRMYMEPSSFDVDNHPRIILWDEKERKYRMAKLNDDTTCLTVKDSLVQLSRFYEIMDYEINPYMPGAGQAQAVKPSVTSLSKMSYTRFIKDYYTRHYWDLNITKDKFVRRIILNEKIQNTFKSPNACPKRDTTFYPNPDITAEDSVPDLQPFLGSKSKEEMQEKKVIDTDKIKEVEPVDSNDKKEIKPKTEDNKFSDNQFFGPWFTFKTTHTIVINGTPKDSVPQMVERLQLIKPWEITPVPQVLRK